MSAPCESVMEACADSRHFVSVIKHHQSTSSSSMSLVIQIRTSFLEC